MPDYAVTRDYEIIFDTTFYLVDITRKNGGTFWVPSSYCLRHGFNPRQLMSAKECEKGKEQLEELLEFSDEQMLDQAYCELRDNFGVPTMNLILGYLLQQKQERERKI